MAKMNIQFSLPSFDELKSEVSSSQSPIRPTGIDRSMNVIRAAASTKRLRVAAYCRVSKDKEDQQSSIAIQKEHFTSEAAKHDDWLFMGIYADIVSGTKKEKRPELKRLLSDCAAGRVNLVMTKSVSRFARNTTDLLEMVRSLTAAGTDIVFERENLDTRTMSSEFLLTILASLAEDESHSISDNCRWGLQKRFENGTYRAATAPYGYDLVDGNYAVNETEAAVVQEIFTRTLAGETQRAIAEDLNVRNIPTKRAGQKWKGKELNPKWEGLSIARILRNVSYTGDQIFQKQFTDQNFRVRRNKGQQPQFYQENHHPAIIDKTTFETVQELLEKNKSHCATGEKQYTTLSCMLVCGHCGSHLTRQVNGAGNVYWVCHRRRKRAADCPMDSIKEEALIADFENIILDLRADDSLVREHLEQIKTEHDSIQRVRKLRSRIEQIDQEIAGLNNIITRVRPADYRSRQNELAAEREMLQSELAQMCDNRIEMTEELLRVIHSGSFVFEDTFKRITDSVTVHDRGHYTIAFCCGLAVEYDGRE